MSSQEEKSKDLKIQYLKNMLGDVILEALNDDAITDLCLNDDGNLWFDSSKKGRYLAGSMDKGRARGFLSQLAQMNEVYLNDKNPTIDATLPFNNERLAGSIEPMSKAPTFTIRKPAREIFTLESYVDIGTMTKEQFKLICDAISKRKNIVISGATHTGKTTLLNSCLLKMYDIFFDTKRVLILQGHEDEIQCSIPNSVKFFSNDDVSMTKLLKVSMRYSPDSIIVGEVRDKACLDLLKAWNTGHDGGLSTIHANSASAVPLRLSYLAQEAGVPAPNQLIVEAVDLIIQIVKDSSSQSGRRIKEIVEIIDYKDNSFIFKSIN